MESPTAKTGYCFLANSESRDFYILIAFIYFLEKYKNCQIQFEFIWNAHKIYQEKPDFVILPNSRGEVMYYEIANYCFENNILVFNHDSEGNFRTDLDFDFWGLNLKRHSFCPKIFTWNKRTTEFIKKKYRFPDDIVCLTGNPGIDKYKYLQKADRETILKKYNKQHFKHVVGYAGWAFGKIYYSEVEELVINLGKPREEAINWTIRERDCVKEVLKSAIEKYPEVLFILKKHPRENFDSNLKESPNEMNEFVDYPNVLYVKNEEDIQDLINISDIWTAFESTSIMEAWLVNKPTIIIKNDVDFDPVHILKGSYVVNNSTDFITALQKTIFDKDRSFIEPEEIVTNRKMILTGSFGFDDGFNHLRCYYYFGPYLESLLTDSTKPAINWSFLKKKILMNVGKLFYVKKIFEKLPKLKKTVWIFENYTLSKIKESQKDVYKDLDTFYEKEDLDKSIRSGEIWKRL